VILISRRNLRRGLSPAGGASMRRSAVNAIDAYCDDLPAAAVCSANIERSIAFAMA
jgi:hypothetical protein